MPVVLVILTILSVFGVKEILSSRNVEDFCKNTPTKLYIEDIKWPFHRHHRQETGNEQSD